MHDIELILQLTVYAVSFTSGNIYLLTRTLSELQHVSKYTFIFASALTVYSYQSTKPISRKKICLFCLHANNKLVISFAFIGIADTPWQIFLQLLFLERVQTVH